MHNNVVRIISEDNDIILFDQEKLIGKDLKWFGDVWHLSEEGIDKFIDNIKRLLIEHKFLNMAFIFQKAL